MMKAILTFGSWLFLALCNIVSPPETALIAGRQAAAKPGEREGHCLVYDGQRRQVILLDGYQPPDLPERGEVWSWDGRQWHLIPGTGPAARSLSGAVFDSRRKKIVEFGGVGNSGYDDTKGDTWEWDGKNWRQMTDTGIGTRDHHAMAYDAVRGKTVLYGGQHADRSWAKDTWEWDSKQWTKFAVPGPGGRVHAAMAYDGKRKKVILFGGGTEDGRARNDTWEWDGRAWHKLSDDGPPPRSHHRLAFDSRAGVMLLYGGNGVRPPNMLGLSVLADMWQWDGQHWAEIKATGPGKRLLHAMVYDEARGKLVLYGGGNGRKSLADTWEWDGRQWKQIK